MREIDAFWAVSGRPNTSPEVGKKLSEKTTRRVILLVLVMMLVLPFLKAGKP